MKRRLINSYLFIGHRTRELKDFCVELSTFCNFLFCHFSFQEFLLDCFDNTFQLKLKILLINGISAEKKDEESNLGYFTKMLNLFIQIQICNFVQIVTMTLRLQLRCKSC
jgi:hypothetical protein